MPANKGAVVTTLSELLSVPSAEIAAIGDMPNDVLMFRKSGLSIAMGNASPQVQAQADFVTGSCSDEGFAYAMERFILGASVRGPAGGPMTPVTVAAPTTMRPLSLAFATARPNKEAAP